MNEDEFCVAHMLAKTGDVMKYQYDLGDHNDHDIEVSRVKSSLCTTYLTILSLNIYFLWKAAPELSKSLLGLVSVLWRIARAMRNGLRNSRR